MVIYVDDNVALEFSNFFSEFKIFEKQEPSVLLISCIFLALFSFFFLFPADFYFSLLQCSVRVPKSRIWFYRHHQVEYLGLYMDYIQQVLMLN